MKHIKLFEQFVNESKAYNLGLKSSAYMDALIKALQLKHVKISEFNGMDTAHKVFLYSEDGMHGTDLTNDIKDALKDFDKNLDLDAMTNDLEADENNRSKSNQERGITSYRIPKKVDYHQDKKGNYSEPDVVKMSHEVVIDIMDMMAGYTSSATHLADVQWNTLKDFLNSAKDEMSAANFKKLEKSVKEKYPNLK